MKKADLSPGEIDVLRALRVGPISTAEFNERGVDITTLSLSLRRRGYLTTHDAVHRLTDAGRAACPLRNPLAATITPAPVGATGARHPRANRLTAPVTPQRPLAHPSFFPETRMSKPATDNDDNNTLAAILATLQGVKRSHALTQRELGQRLPNRSKDAIRTAIGVMVRSGVVAAYGATTARRYYDPEADGVDTSAASLPIGANLQTSAPTEPPSAPVAPAVEAVPLASPAKQPAPAASTDPEDIEFAMYDDGRLGIFNGDEILIIPPEATIRLGRFLGCFDAHIN